MIQVTRKLGVAMFALSLLQFTFGQRPAAASRAQEPPDVFKLQLTVASDGAQARIGLTVTNLTVVQQDYPAHVIIQVYRTGGAEAPTTLLQRQLTGKRKEHEAPLLDVGGYEPPIAPGAFFTRFYRVADYYDLSQPGDYQLRVTAFATTAVINGKLSLIPKPIPIKSDTVTIHVP